jgi:hypothetical protein
VFGPSDGDVQPAQVRQKAESSRNRSVFKVVGSNAVENDYVLLLALIGIDTVDVQVILFAVK